MPSIRPSPLRPMLVFAVIAALAGPIGTVLGEAVDQGKMGVGIFGMLLIVIGFLLRPVARQLEAIALGVKRQPWLGGRLRRWQKLILPLQTGAVLATGLSCVMSGGGYLLSAPQGWSAPNVVAFAFVLVGGLLTGFALSRLLAGILILHVSGLWAAPRWAWRVGGAIVVAGSLAHGVYSAENILHLAPSV